jgi:hypothetical protein
MACQDDLLGRPSLVKQMGLFQKVATLVPKQPAGIKYIYRYKMIKNLDCMIRIDPNVGKTRYL